MSTTPNDHNDLLNLPTTKSISQTDTNVATNENEVAKRIKQPLRDKSHFEATTTRPNWRKKGLIVLPRCQAFRRGLDEQCNMIACTKRGHNVCRSHGGGKNIGKRSAAGEAKRLEACTKHGELSKAAVAKKNKRVKEHRLLTKVAIALELQKYPVRGEQLKAYPKPTLASLPELIRDLEKLEE